MCNVRVKFAKCQLLVHFWAIFAILISKMALFLIVIVIVNTTIDDRITAPYKRIELFPKNYFHKYLKHKSHSQSMVFSKASCKMITCIFLLIAFWYKVFYIPYRFTNISFLYKTWLIRMNYGRYMFFLIF